MPRKINTGVDYYEDYDDFEDYDYDYDVEENVEVLESKQETSRAGIWRCSICTYDNDQSMSACDICGVLRNPLVTMSRADNTTAPFKFDAPSPDDLVSNGLRSSKMGSKVNFNDVMSSKISSADEQLNAERSDSLSAMTETRNQSNKGIVNKQGSANSSEALSSALVKGSHGCVEESSYTKNISINIKSNDKRSSGSSASEPKGRRGGVDVDVQSSVNTGKPETLSSRWNNMALDVRSESSSNASSRKTLSSTQYKPEKWMLPNQAEETLIQLNLAIVGHVDSGKSTLSGRLLHVLGRISQKQMHKYEKEAKIQGKGSFAYAWALDESSEERERGITMTVAVAYFDSKRYHVVVLDSPGHKDFVPNMISGATQADAAILVIDASIGSFEAGMDSMKGQTREHAQLIRSFGVEQIIVAINKMDVIEYSKDRFDLIKQQLGIFLRSCGFKDSSVSWIPLSAMENQNLVAAPSDVRFLSWYKGPHLLDAIDSFHPPSREFSKPLLMPICDVIKLPSLGQVSACGKLEAGAIRSGLKVLLMPSGQVGTVRSLERDSQPCAVARAGDNVAVSLQGIDGSNVMAGGVLCHPDFPVSFAKHLEVKVLLLDVITPVLVGSQLELHIHHAKEVARIAKITSLLDPKTGKVAKKAPRCLTAKQSAVVEVILQGPVCVEEFSSSRALGRVFLRSLGRTVAVGIVTRIIE
ncbi:hypothetical protein UlMin_035585 [Ulmus minor]